MPTLSFAACCVFSPALAGVSPTQPDEILHVPIELEAGSTVIPPCTPLQMVSESPAGRTVELLAVGPGWDRIKVKAKALEVDRFDDLSECVRAGDYYNRRYPAEVLDGFDGSELVFGMPVEFALMALGPPDKVSWNGWEKKSAYRWGPASSPGLHYSKLQSVSVERLFNAPSVVIEEIDPDSVSRLKRILEETTGQKDPLVTAGIVGIHVWELELAQTEQNDALLKAPPRDQSEFRLLYDQGLDLYEQGDHAGAFSMWLALAEDGYAVAQYSVGDLYYRAEGVERDLEQAVYWFREAALGHYPFSQYQLGYLYATGEGVPRDLVEAHRWMQAAERLGHSDAGKARTQIEKSMSPEEMGAARRLFEENNVVESPVLLAHRNPEYPDLARVARVDGQVILQAIVGVDGRVEDVEVIRVNRPNLGFEEAAIDALKHWRYKPAMQGGKAVRVYVTVVVDFGLEDKGSHSRR